jgi:hypothetical protein
VDVLTDEALLDVLPFPAEPAQVFTKRLNSVMGIRKNMEVKVY